MIMNESITSAQLSEAVDWTSDCIGLSGANKVGDGFAFLYVQENYPGGWDAFVQECCTSVGLAKINDGAGTSETIMDVQQHTEDGITYRTGQRVERVDWEGDGTPAYRGTLTRIELDAGEAYYWIAWDGADAPDHHGPYAFRTI